MKTYNLNSKYPNLISTDNLAVAVTQVYVNAEKAWLNNEPEGENFPTKVVLGINSIRQQLAPADRAVLDKYLAAARSKLLKSPEDN